MRRTSVVGAAALLAGCSVMGGGAIADNICDPGKSTCAIAVVVNAAAGGGCTIKDPGTTRVKKNKAPVLQWKIQNTGGGQFKFIQDGIKFKAAPPTGEFSDQGPKANGAEYHIKDNNKQKPPQDREFRYKITVVKQDNSPGCFLDPIVLNEGCDSGTC